MESSSNGISSAYKALRPLASSYQCSFIQLYFDILIKTLDFVIGGNSAARRIPEPLSVIKPTLIQLVIQEVLRFLQTFLSKPLCSVEHGMLCLSRQSGDLYSQLWSVSAIASTIPVYQKQASLHNNVTKIVSCQSTRSLPETDRALFKDAEDIGYVITTGKTIFHRQGGGQLSDVGQIKLEREQSVSFDVKLVRETAESQIYHLGRFSGSEQLLREGDAVIQIIDTAKRNYHSRYHTAGHALGLAVNKLWKRLGMHLR